MVVLYTISYFTILYNILYTIYYMLYTIYSILYTIYYILYTIYYIVYSTIYLDPFIRSLPKLDRILALYSRELRAVDASQRHSGGHALRASTMTNVMVPDPYHSYSITYLRFTTNSQG